MYLSILLLPLLGSISAGLFGRKLGSTGSQIVTIICLVVASILASIAFYEVAICSSPINIYLTSWINSELLTINWEFMFDQLSVSMILTVSYISTIVHIYSVSYMNGDPAMYSGKILMWGKLSNSGDLLKLLIPNYI